MSENKQIQRYKSKVWSSCGPCTVHV